MPLPLIAYSMFCGMHIQHKRHIEMSQSEYVRIRLNFRKLAVVRNFDSDSGTETAAKLFAVQS